MQEYSSTDLTRAMYAVSLKDWLQCFKFRLMKPNDWLALDEILLILYFGCFSGRLSFLSNLRIFNEV